MTDTRPYREIKNSAGDVLCTTPDKGGPVEIGGQHPEDYFAPDKDGVATKNLGTPTAKAAASADPSTSAWPGKPSATVQPTIQQLTDANAAAQAEIDRLRAAAQTAAKAEADAQAEIARLRAEAQAKPQGGGA